MKSFLKKSALLVTVASMALATQLNALTIAQSFGAIADAQPSSPAAETAFINALLGISPVGENAPSFPALFDDGGGNLDRFSTVVPGNPAATATGAFSSASPSASINVTGWTYLYAKFGNGAYVWYVGNLSGLQSLPLEISPGTGSGQSHYALFNPGTSVPDGGATVALLGLGLAALALIRRKISS